MSGEKSEKATPKKKDDARKKGQVAKSPDLSGSVVMMAGLLTLGSVGPAVAGRMGDQMRGSLTQIADPSVVSYESVGVLMEGVGAATLLAVAPIAAACIVAGVVASVLQVGFKPSSQALKPDFKRVNPLSGAKNIFGPNMLAETVKSVSKVGVVGAIVFAMVAPKIAEFGGLVGVEPITLSARLASDIEAIAMRACIAYFVIGILDFVWARHKLDKSLKMDLQEVKEEFKGQSLPPEVRAQQRRRAMGAARARMMEAVPEADVIVTNPTHFAVALKYDGTRQAPLVVAKGQDLIALRIREIAKEAGVPIVEDKPLARGLHASVEVDREIPEEFFAAVAAVLAWVYRTKKRVA